MLPYMISNSAYWPLWSLSKSALLNSQAVLAYWIRVEGTVVPPTYPIALLVARVRAAQGLEQSGIQGMGANLSWRGSSRQYHWMVLVGRLQEQGTGFTRTLSEQSKAESLESYPIRGMHLSSVSLVSQARSLSWGFDFFRVEGNLLFALNKCTLIEDVALELGLSGTAKSAETASNPLSMVSTIHYLPAFSPWQFSFRTFHLSRRNDLIQTELPSFGREWGSFSRASTQQGWELGAQAKIMESAQLYLRLGSAHEMLPSGYNRFPEQRSEWSIEGSFSAHLKNPPCRCAISSESRIPYTARTFSSVCHLGESFDYEAARH